MTFLATPVIACRLKIVGLAYIFGLCLLPRQLRVERRNTQAQARGSDALPLKPSPPSSSKKTFRGAKISLPIPIHEEEEWKREEEHQDEMAGGTGYNAAMSDTGHELRRPVAFGNAL